MTKLDYYWIMAERQKHASDEAFARAIEAKARAVALNDAAIAANELFDICDSNDPMRDQLNDRLRELAKGE